MSKSTRSRAARKPRKPRPVFPLFPHANGRWARKVKGKLCYFGKWDEDPEGERALRLWSDQKDDLLAGKPQPQVTGKRIGGVTIKRVVNDSLNAKRRLLDAEEITTRTFGEYHAVGLKLAAVLGPQREVPV